MVSKKSPQRYNKISTYPRKGSGQFPSQVTDYQYKQWTITFFMDFLGNFQDKIHQKFAHFSC